MAKFRLMTDDHNLTSLVQATPQKGIDALEHRRARHALAVDLTLQLLPRQLAVWQQADRSRGLPASGPEILARSSRVAAPSPKTRHRK